MSPELKWLARLPRRLRTPIDRRSPKQNASRVVRDLVGLPEFSDRLQEVAGVMAIIKQDQTRQNPYLGHATRDIDTAIAVVTERIRSGLLSPEVGERYLDALSGQRKLSLQQPLKLKDKIDSATEELFRTTMSRRGALVIGGAAGVLAAGEIGRRIISSKQESQIELERQLDKQPKVALSEGASDLSKHNWRVRTTHKERFVPSGRHPGLYLLNDGFVFNFDRSDSGNGIAIRALRNDKEIVPFLRVYPSKGAPKDYIVGTNKDERGDLVTEVVVFEKPERALTYYTQFKPLVSGNTFRFIGYYLDPAPDT